MNDLEERKYLHFPVTGDTHEENFGEKVDIRCKRESDVTKSGDL